MSMRACGRVWVRRKEDAWLGAQGAGGGKWGHGWALQLATILRKGSSKCALACVCVWRKEDVWLGVHDADGGKYRYGRAPQLVTILRQSSSKAEPHHHKLTGAHAPPCVDVVLLCCLEVDNGRHAVRAQAEVVPQAADVPPLDGVQVVDARLDTVWQVVTAGGRPHKFAHSATSH